MVYRVLGCYVPLYTQYMHCMLHVCYVLYVGVLPRYAIEKAKYEENLKQESPAVRPPVAALAPPPPHPAPTPVPSMVPQISFPSSASKGRKDSDSPKRPRTAYILFSMEFRKTLDPSIGFNDGTKLVSHCLMQRLSSANIGNTLQQMLHCQHV